MQPSGDGYYYMPASQDLINLGIFEGVELTENKYDEADNSNTVSNIME